MVNFIKTAPSEVTHICNAVWKYAKKPCHSLSTHTRFYFNKKRISCHFSKSSENILLQFSTSYLCEQKFSHFSPILNAKKEIVCVLLRKNCEHARQKFRQEFNICAKKKKKKKKKLKYHIKSKLYNDFVVKFILMFQFKFILTCYFDTFKGKLR
jgi:hypothetical protein